MEKYDFEMDVIFNEELQEFVKDASGLEEREQLKKINYFNKNSPHDHILCLYGLKGSGKKTLMKQSILALPKYNYYETVYIKVRKGDTLSMLENDLKTLFEHCFQYIYIDEVTLIEDFIDCAAVLSDIYASTGMHIICSGTDSLGFYLASNYELYDRVYMVHTSYIPYKEYSRLLNMGDVDSYIKYSGILLDGVFRKRESTNEYVEKAISNNIQTSLMYYGKGTNFRYLKSLYEEGLLNKSVNKVIEDINREFLLSVINSIYEECKVKSEDKKGLELLLQLTKESNSATNIYDENQRDEIKEYITNLEIIKNVSRISLRENENNTEKELFTISGLRYSEVKSCLYSLLENETVNSGDKEELITLVMNEVMEEMLKEIVLLNTLKKYNKKKNIFVLSLDGGGFDMVVLDEKTFFVELYEIKYSDKLESKMSINLTNDLLIMQVRNIYGRIIRRCVLYMGESFENIEGIEYKNVGEFLKE